MPALRWKMVFEDFLFAYIKSIKYISLRICVKKYHPGTLLSECTGDVDSKGRFPHPALFDSKNQPLCSNSILVEFRFIPI
jgi:hypothetical protein